MPTAGFHYPYYGGGGPILIDGGYGGDPTAARPVPYTVSLHGIEYPIELSAYRRRSIRSLEHGPVVESRQPDDSQFNNDGAWWRYVYDWSDGAGQVIQDLGDDDVPTRFDDSRGVDVWTDYQLSLLPTTELKEAAAAANVLLIATGAFVYMADGAGVKRSSDLSTWSSLTGLTGTIRDFSTDGSDVYIATSTHIYKASDGGGLAATVVTVNTDDYQKVAFVSNRLLAAANNVLYEIDNVGARSAIETHFQTEFRWTTIFNIGSRVYAGGFAGSRTELYGLTANSSGVLVPGAEAAPFAFNELLRNGISYAGVALLATSLGVRMAILSGDGSLTYGPLIDAPGNVTSLVAEGRFAWFGWDGFFGEGSGLGRMALDNTVRTLQPAYASDVYTTDAVAAVTGVARFGSVTLFGVANEGVYATTTTPLSSGWLRSSRIYLGTVELKRLLSISTTFAKLPTGGSVAVAVSGDETSELGSGSISLVNARQLEVELAQASSEWAQVTVTLGATATSPVVSRWRLRGFPIVPMVQEWIVPLILHRNVVVNDGQGQVRSQDPLVQVERLILAARTKQAVAYREGARTYAVRIEEFEMQPHEWDDTSDFFDNLFVVRLISVR